MAKWIQGAVEEMDRKGTRGKFGKATRSKIAKAKKRGGVEKKRAVFAQNMKKIAAEHKHERNYKRHWSQKKMALKRA